MGAVGFAALVAYVLSVVVAPAIAAIVGHDIHLSASGNLTNTSQLAGWFGNPPAWLIVPVPVAIVGIGLSFVARQVGHPVDEAAWVSAQ
jgi:hypothetical protein